MNGRKKFLVVFALLFVILTLLTGTAAAVTYQLDGRVTDQSGNAIADTLVEVINPATGVTVATTTAGGSGNYALSLEEGTYNVRVTPPVGSGFGPSVALNQTMDGDIQLDFVLVPAGTVVLSGRVTDTDGNGIPGQRVELTPVGTYSTLIAHTDASGVYSHEVAPGDYHIMVQAVNNSSSVNAPETYYMRSDNPISLSESTVLDIPLPVKKVSLHVQDPAGNPVPNVRVITTSPTNWDLVFAGLPAQGQSGYDVYPGIYTDASGDVTLWLFPASNTSYSFVATPPSGSGLVATSVTDVSFSTDTSRTIVLKEPVVLSGRVTDTDGNGIPGQRVELTPVGTYSTLIAHTDASGVYSHEVAPGDYHIMVQAVNNSSSVNAPETYYMRSDNPISLSESTVLDIPLPVKKVSLHVQDPAGNPVPNVRVITTSPTNWDLVFAGLPAQGQSGYDVYPGIYTDASGDVTLWLFPTSNTSYSFVATPPSDSPFTSFSLTNVDVTTDKASAIVLQFVHPPPNTQATLSPTANSDGTYSDPVTVTLSANAASGYTIANTYYSIDGGPEQTYTGPFTVPNEGEHVIEYWSIDDAGVYETPKTKAFTIRNPFTDVGISAGDISFTPAVPDPGQPVTIKARVRNLGLQDAAGVEVAVADFGTLLGQQTIASLPAGTSEEVTFATTYAATGLRLISVEVDPADLISEVNEENNEASKLLQVGELDLTQGYMVIQASSATACQGKSLAIGGQAYYDFAEIPGENDHPIQGGKVTVTILDPASGATLNVYTGATTNINGAYSQPVLAPGSDGTYPVVVEITDKTVVQTQETTLTVSGACPEPPPIPPPPPGGSPPPSAPPGTSPTVYGDVYVRSQDIYFSDDNPVPGSTTNIFAYIHYYGSEPVHDIPVTVNHIYPVDGVLRTFTTGTAEVSFPNGSSSSPVAVTVPWEANPQGAHVIQIVAEPPFDQYLKNDKATRLILVGDVPLLDLLKEVSLLVDVDGDGNPDPGDTLQYTLSYSNDGSGPATGVVILDNYDEELLATPTQIGGGGTSAEGALSWDLGTLAAGEAGSVSYQTTIVDESQFPTGEVPITNYAMLSADGSPADADQVTVLVAVNAPPTVDAGQDQTVDEGTGVSLTATGDDYDDDPLTYAWDLDGDGTFETPGQSVIFTADDGPASHTVSVQVTDAGGLSATDSLVITVLNVAPAATFNASTPVAEGSAISLSLTDATDPSSADTAAGFQYAFDCGDGSGYGAFSSNSTASCPTTDNGIRTVRATIRDKDGDATEYSAEVTIENVAPTAEFTASPATIDEGQDATANFANPGDPSTGDSAAGFSYSYDCEDDGTFEATNVTDAAYSCHYPDNGTFTIRGRIQDKDGGATAYTAPVTVNNVAPTVGPITAPVEPVLIGSEISASADFTDPGVLDTHTAVWDWDDGASSAGTVTEVDGSGAVDGSHTYTTPDVYTIKLTVTDKDGASEVSFYQFVVVYDPEGGFVTGGGWIRSQPGACVLETICVDVEGKANFGFVSKYKKGATVPTGNTEFNFAAGGLKFHSGVYEWLVVNQGGTNAQFKGSGTINGEPAPNGELYRFTIWAKDDDPDAGDTFRIRIWYEAGDEEIEVYDNGFDQTLGGGKIQIHE